MTTKDTVPTAEVAYEVKSSTFDWQELRERSLRPGGFGSERGEIWPWLLNVSSTTTIETKEDELSSIGEEHRDERQIRLDTDRSFVIYPTHTLGDRETMQEKLNHLLVTIFRRHPKLNYFQGYHDIISVLYLTLPDALQLACAEKISLHRVRDSMGSTLEPILGLLRVTKNLLRIADLEYAQSLEQSSPLPFYALSNLLTLFSHDIPTLPLIQHVLDYILCRPPIIIVYLATAIILYKKDEIVRLEQEEEDEGMGMAHSILSMLPPISDGVEEERLDTEVNGLLDELGVEKREKRTISGVNPSENAVANSEESLGAENVITASQDGSGYPVDEQVSAGGRGEKESFPDHTRPRSLSPTSARPQRPAIALSSLLTQADKLYALYPPSHAELSLSSIMGPQSVVYTWSESPDALPTDEEAEAMVSRPELVVYPYIEEEADEEDDEEDAYVDKKSESKSSRRKRAKGKLRERVKGKLGRWRRIRPERRTGTMVTGAVLVLGVAIAVYGIKTRGMQPIYRAGNGAEGHGREWKKLAGWIGSAVVGVTERVFSKSTSSEHLHN